MTIDVEKGIHWPTLISATMAVLSLNMYTQLLQPNFPFLIKNYFPDVVLSFSVHSRSLVLMLDTMLDTLFHFSFSVRYLVLFSGDGLQIVMDDEPP